MQIRVNLMRDYPPKRSDYRAVVLAIALTVPLIFNSCSIFTPRPDDTSSKDSDQIYQSQRAKRPDLSAPPDHPPFWYWERGTHPKNLPPEGSTTNQSFLKSKALQPKIFLDDMDPDSLRNAVRNQLLAMASTDPSKAERLGELMVTRNWLEETLKSFLKLIDENLPPEEFSRRLRDEYVVHRVGNGKSKKVLFTGYYAPILEASRVRTEEYRYPLYQLPDTSQQIQFIGHRTGYEVLESSSPNAREWHQYTRGQIDGEGILKGHGLEIAWLRDDVDRFFLHVQGSGLLRYLDGSTQGVHFAGANNYKYGGLGRHMVEDGVIELKQGSMQGIKKYFREHPEDIPKYFFQNKRYIFFSPVDDGGPRGSGGGELVGGRSIATDKTIYPAGGLAYVQLRKPILDENNNITRWEKFSRFVIDQDTGNAIRGAGRADFYFGMGDRAGAKAGHYYERGKVYYLIKRITN